MKSVIILVPTAKNKPNVTLVTRRDGKDIYLILKYLALTRVKSARKLPSSPVTRFIHSLASFANERTTSILQIAFKTTKSI